MMTSKSITIGGISEEWGTQVFWKSKALNGCQWQETASLIAFLNLCYSDEFASV